jgi:hypothetical protein
LAIFPWADHNSKTAMKLHVGLDHGGRFPAFTAVTDGVRHDVSVGRGFDFPTASAVVIDKSYTDYGRYKQLTDKGIFFITGNDVMRCTGWWNAGKRIRLKV